ncbi:MAG: GNAT family N-acetyltransferase [Spirochaetaceae bacterium]|nr:GNAT family N-acetyltransferase [Spirochaetaceae bacterium]
MRGSNLPSIAPCPIVSGMSSSNRRPTRDLDAAFHKAKKSRRNRVETANSLEAFLDRIRISRLTPEDRLPARELVERYVRSLEIDLSFQEIGSELEDFPSKYSEPQGAFLLAKDGDVIVGCVGLKRLDDETCEMKRLYVADSHKGKGIGKRLVGAIIAEAIGKSYKKMRLDTLEDMHAAQSLYRGFGFHCISAYVYNPIKGAIFMEKNLDGN